MTRKTRVEAARRNKLYCPVIAFQRTRDQRAVDNSITTRDLSKEVLH